MASEKPSPASSIHCDQFFCHVVNCEIKSAFALHCYAVTSRRVATCQLPGRKVFLPGVRKGWEGEGSKDTKESETNHSRVNLLISVANFSSKFWTFLMLC